MDWQVQNQECPSPEQLARLLDETLSIDQSVADHVDSCLACQRTLDDLLVPSNMETYLVRAKSGTLADAGGQTKANISLAIDGFTLLSEIGRGGMGVVYCARDEKLQRMVAIKLLKRGDSLELDSRFERESFAAAKVDHPNVVPVFSFGRIDDGRPYLVMPLVAGKSLEELLQKEPMQARDAARLVVSVANGLSAAHQLNLVHRDVKPGNILIDEKDGLAKLLDFGLVRGLDDQTLTQTAMLCGTPEYMSPEQADQFEKTEARSDIYSLGITLYECLTGTVPFRGRPLDVLNQHRESEPIPPSRMNQSIPKDLETICLKAIEKEPSLRYESANALARDLNRFLDGREIAARPIGHIQKTARWANRNKALATTISLLFLALALGTATSTTMWLRSESNAAIAEKNADDLNASRLRMRNSVRSFQRRVFTDKSMHWQMPANMRAEMFAEVIEYLDEFARLDIPDPTKSKMLDEITDDYVEIARAALEVGQRKESRLASDKALARIRQLNSIEQPIPENIELHFEALRVAYASLDEKETTQRRDLANEALQIAKDVQARILNEVTNSEAAVSGEIFWNVNLLIAESMTIVADPKQLEAGQLRLKEIYESLISTNMSSAERKHKTELRARLTANEIGWRLIELVSQDDAIAIAAENQASIDAIRSHLRILRLPLSATEWLRGKTHSALANAHTAHDDLDAAVQSAIQSKNAFQRAINIQPRNLIWRNDQAAIMLRLSDWLAEQGNLNSAVEELTYATKSCVAILRFDADNMQMRIQIIKMLVKLAGLSERLKRHENAATEYYVAAQDCRFLLGDESLRQWGYDIRLWLLSKVVEQSPKHDNENFKASFLRNEKQFLENSLQDPDLDSSNLQSILDGEFQPDRPKELDSERLTGDIIDEMTR